MTCKIIQGGIVCGDFDDGPKRKMVGLVRRNGSMFDVLECGHELYRSYLTWEEHARRGWRRCAECWAEKNQK